MSRPLTEATAAQAALELYLGDPRREDSRISFRAALALDEREEFPARAVAALDAWELPRYYVPQSCGGALRSFEVLAALIRCMARRDLTVAIAHAKTFLGAVPVWLAGTEAQQQALAAAIHAGAKVALGLTEEAHGGDLLATETTASATPDGSYELAGVKWLINNATRSDAITVLARTTPQGGPRGLSLFLIPKREVQGYVHLPKIPTHGIRGADISGIRFEQCAVSASARIGATGYGLEIVMKSLQLTRTVVPALSLGALETALQQVLTFANARRIGSSPVAQIPHARRALSESFIELLAAEAIVRAATRSIHIAPERLAVRSAVVKYLTPSRTDAALRRLAVVLGARHYLRGTLMEKLLRDHSLVGLFDGSTVVNLCALAQELPYLHKRRMQHQESAVRAQSQTLYGFASALPAFEPARLALMNHGGDELTPLVQLAQTELAQIPVAALDPAVRSFLHTMLAALDGELAAASGQLQTQRMLALPPEAFAAAARYAHVHAALSCVLVWLYNRSAFDEFFAAGEWLALALYQLLLPAAAPPVAAWYERAFARLCALAEAGQNFSLEPSSAGTQQECA